MPSSSFFVYSLLAYILCLQWQIFCKNTNFSFFSLVCSSNEINPCFTSPLIVVLTWRNYTDTAFFEKIPTKKFSLRSAVALANDCKEVEKVAKRAILEEPSTYSIYESVARCLSENSGGGQADHNTRWSIGNISLSRGLRRRTISIDLNHLLIIYDQNPTSLTRVYAAFNLTRCIRVGDQHSIPSEQELHMLFLNFWLVKCSLLT